MPLASSFLSGQIVRFKSDAVIQKPGKSIRIPKDKVLTISDIFLAVINDEGTICFNFEESSEICFREEDLVEFVESRPMDSNDIMNWFGNSGQREV